MDTRLSKLTASNLSWPSVKRVIASSQLSFLCLQQAFTSTSSLLHPSQARPTYPTSCFIGYSPPTLLHLSPSLFSYSLVLSSPQERCSPFAQGQFSRPSAAVDAVAFLLLEFSPLFTSLASFSPSPHSFSGILLPSFLNVSLRTPAHAPPLTLARQHNPLCSA